LDRLGEGEVQSVKVSGRHPKLISVVVATAVLVACLLAATISAAAQPVQDSLVSTEEQVRSLESDIAALQERLGAARNDAVSVAQRLAEVEKSIIDCYMEIDGAEAEVEMARQGLNRGLRQLYIEGRQEPLIKLISSADVTDFLVWSEYVMDVTSREADAFRALKAKKEHLQDCQDKLLAFKKEAAGLAESADTSGIEAQIEAKQAQLADLTSALITMQLPATYAPAPVAFSPTRVYSEPDVNGFVRTGQVMSGYSGSYASESAGKLTASGEIFDQYAFTCGHRTLPFGTWLLVTFRGRKVIVKVNDRGPAVEGRTLDLSGGAADAIGLTGVQWLDFEIVVPRS
jgi:rare lipoprotein A (peptidoglycan hydrolase)/outer membrane murein-binding lipoprotein Lpp